jgi:hypothetical protein
MKRNKNTFLECMFSDLDDIEDGSDEDVIEELREMGIDIDESKKKLIKTIKKCKDKDKK